jgi:oxaloacetate decarboxylase gamma subunit
MQGNLIDQGLMLMLAGMGTVFAFLTVLVALTWLMSRLVLRLQASASLDGPSDDEIAAITAAIATHRRR